MNEGKTSLTNVAPIQYNCFHSAWAQCLKQTHKQTNKHLSCCKIYYEKCSTQLVAEILEDKEASTYQHQ